MGTLGLKKPSTRRTTTLRPVYRPKTNGPTTPRHLGGPDASARLRQMQEDMDKIAGTKS
jgi:hypothetical protein